MSEVQPVRENKMGVMPIPKLLFGMALPIMASMLIQALYNIVDSMFVARISEDALTAVTLVFPVQNLMIAFATGTGVGINALLSRRLGEKRPEEASRVANTGLLLACIIGVIFGVLGALFTRFYFTAQVDIPAIIEHGVDYMSIVTVCSIGLFVEIMTERLLQATGRTMLTMYVQGTGAILNIILDPILIFGWFGLPAMGTAGAALATVIGQILAACLGIYLNIRHNPEIKLSVRQMRFDPKLVREVYAIGFPSIIMTGIGSVMHYLMNQILLGFVATAATVFGAFFKLNSFVFMPVFGINNAVVPIVSYNYGARNRGRIIETIKIACLAGIVIMTLGWAVFFFMPQHLLMLFDASPAMLEIGIPAFKIISWTFILAGFSVVASSVFQALGKSVYSMMVTISRQIVVLIPSAYLLSLTGVLQNVWYSYILAEFACVAASIFFMIRALRLLKDFPQ